MLRVYASRKASPLAVFSITRQLSQRHGIWGEWVGLLCFYLYWRGDVVFEPSSERARARASSRIGNASGPLGDPQDPTMCGLYSSLYNSRTIIPVWAPRTSAGGTGGHSINDFRTIASRRKWLSRDGENGRAEIETPKFLLRVMFLW